jgi:hypothetical protein
VAIYTYSEELSFAWDAWAQSEEILEVDGYFEFSVYNSAGVVCGIASVGIPQHNSEISHGFFIEGSAYRIIEDGTPLGTQMAFSSGDRFRIERRGDQVLYFRNSTQLRETAVSFLGPSRLYAALYSYFDNVVDAVMVLTTSEAEAESSLPALESRAFSDDYASSESALPVYVGESSSADPSQIASILPAMASKGSTDEISYCQSVLPGLSASAEQSVLSPDVTSAMSVLPGLNSYSEAENSPWVDNELPALGMIGLAVDWDQVGQDLAISFPFLPAYSALVDMAQETWFEVEVPLPVIRQFQLAPTLSGKLFTLTGLLEGTSMSCEISGRLTKLRGEMQTGGLMEARLALLQGEAFGSAQVVGQMVGRLGQLEGEAHSGGLMAGELPAFKGEIFGSAMAAGQIAGKVFGLKGSINAQPVHIGLISGRAFELKGSVAANQHSLGQVHGRLAKLHGMLDGTVSEVATISGKLAKLRGNAFGSEAATGFMDEEVFKLHGTLTQTKFSGTHITLKYARR